MCYDVPWFLLFQSHTNSHNQHVSLTKMVRKRFSAMSIPTYLHTSFLKELNISGKWKKNDVGKKICNMPGWRLKTATSRPSKKIFFFLFLQMSWFFKNNFVTPTVIDSIPPLLLYCSPSPPQNFSWLQTITKYSEKESKKNPRFVFIKSHVTMILIGILLRRLSQCSQLPPKVVSFYTV